jgi:hypothetical protein
MTVVDFLAGHATVCELGGTVSMPAGSYTGAWRINTGQDEALYEFVAYVGGR